MTALVVCGMVLGDECKGSITDYLVEQANADLVVKYTGGCNCAHNVIRGDIEHLFSQFGAGTLYGVPTYLDHHFMIEPFAMMNEAKSLEGKIGKSPYEMLSAHPDCPVTTVYHRTANANDQEQIKSGSLKLGIWETRKKSRENPDYLRASDLSNFDSIHEKCKALAASYDFEYDFEWSKRLFERGSYIKVGEFPEAINIVFEGSQGVGLDENLGSVPHTTGSTTTTKYAVERCAELGIPYRVVGCTRTYGTRHGPGPIADESLSIPERHVDMIVGHFRTGYLDVEMVRRHLIQERCDILALSHCDRKPDKMIMGGLVSSANMIEALTEGTEIYSLIESFGPKASDKIWRAL